MTSKAAKKAYLKANQGGGPKVSRAEQRRLDKEAVERLNREHERERAAAKAKAAREKKAAKVNAEKEERKRKEIPEPSRFVRASQPTISRFVRPGNKRTVQEMEDVDEEEEDTPADDTIAEDTMAEEVAFEPIVGGLVGDGKSVAITTNMEPPAKKIAMDMSSDDEFGDFPSLSQSDIFQKMDSPMPSFQDQKVVPMSAQKELSDPGSDDFPTLSQCELLEKGNLPPGAITISRNCTPIPQRPSTKSPPPGKEVQELKPKGDGFRFTESQLLVDMGGSQPLSETAEANKIHDGLDVAQTTSKPATVAVARNTVNSQTSHTTPRTINSPKRPSASRTVNMPPHKSMPSRYPLYGRSANTMPPPALLKVHRATSFPPTSRSSVQQAPVRQRKRPAQNSAPTPTQAFIENNLDDFFPSPSQEIRELLDDIDDMPSNTQIAKELSPVKQISKDVNDPLKDLFPLPDFAISSQDMLEMDTPSRLPNQPAGRDNRTVHQPLPRSSLGKETIMKPPQILPPTSKGRDLARSSSFNKIHKPSPLEPPLPENATRPPPNTTFTRPRSRNETPKPYLPPHQLIHQKNTHPRSQSESWSPKPPPIPPKTPLSPPPKRRFFEEKDEDLVIAAMLESMREAEAAEKARQQAQAQEKARQRAGARAKAKERVQELAPQQAQVETQAKVSINESPSRNKRTLQRAQSSVTDYGDDEFSGCSQELLALC